MSTLTITRPPRLRDPWFAEIEQVWDELEASVNDIETRVVALEGGSNVLDTPLTGFSSTTGTVTSSDSILTGIEKLNGNLANVKTTADSALPSSSFTDTAVTGKILTGYSSGAGTIAATDTILQAFNKLNGNDALNLPLTGGTLSGDLIVGNQHKISFQEPTGTGSNTISLEAPDSIPSSKIFKLPNADGASGQFIKTDGSGNLSFSTPSGTGGTLVNTSSTVGTSNQILTSTVYADLTNMSVTITTAKTNEVVFASFYGEFYSNGSGGQALELAYVVGAGTPVMVQIITNPGSGSAFPLTIYTPIVLTGSPGSYTVKIQYKLTGSSPTWTFSGTTDGQVFGTLSISQIA